VSNVTSPPQKGMGSPQNGRASMDPTHFDRINDQETTCCTPEGKRCRFGGQCCNNLTCTGDLDNPGVESSSVTAP